MGDFTDQLMLEIEIVGFFARLEHIGGGDHDGDMPRDRHLDGEELFVGRSAHGDPLQNKILAPGGNDEDSEIKPQTRGSVRLMPNG